MDAKQKLNKIKRLDQLINLKLKEVELLRKLSTTLSPQIMQERVQTTKRVDKIAEIVAKIIDLEQGVDEEIERFVDLKAEVHQCLQQLKNYDERLVLELRYIHYKTWEDIAIKTGYSYRNVHYIHGRALKNFESLHTIAH